MGLVYIFSLDFSLFDCVSLSSWVGCLPSRGFGWVVGCLWHFGDVGEVVLFEKVADVPFLLLLSVPDLGG